MRAHNWRGDAAQAASVKALRLSPNDPEVLVRQAGFDTHRDEHEQAISNMLRAVQLDPNSGRVLHELGYALHASGQHRRANQVLEKCLELNPHEAVCSIMLARSQFALIPMNPQVRAETSGTIHLPLPPAFLRSAQ